MASCSCLSLQVSRMRTVLEYYEIYPKVYLAGERSRVTVRALGRHAAFGAGTTWRIRVIPMNDSADHLRHPFSQEHPYCSAHPAADHQSGEREKRIMTSEEMQLSFEWVFPSEQEYTLEILQESRQGEAGGRQPGRRLEQKVYAVERDLFGRIPLKGNMHMHSFRSDGKEAPEIVAASYRRAGYDFIAITDHARYEPSLEAIDAYRDVPLDLKMFPGEEVHAPDNNIHIINFAGLSSVNEWIRGHVKEYYEACEQRRRDLGLPDEFRYFEYASSQWVFDQIRQSGGLAILAHPNWIWCGSYNIPSDLYRRFLKDGGFDALELINGGNRPEENEAQIAVWQEERAHGSQAVATGSDDSHGSVNGEYFDNAKTYVLARSSERSDILSAIRSSRCIAALQYRGESAHYYGDARMIAYMAFLEREYFPVHDDMCIEEGRMMKAYVCGEASAASRLNMLYGQTRALAERLLQVKGPAVSETSKE